MEDRIEAQMTHHHIFPLCPSMHRRLRRPSWCASGGSKEIRGGWAQIDHGAADLIYLAVVAYKTNAQRIGRLEQHLSAHRPAIAVVGPHAGAEITDAHVPAAGNFFEHSWPNGPEDA